VNCDRIAPHYAWIEHTVFGWELENRRHRFLPEVEGARRVLALGEGDGRFLWELVRANPEAEIDYVDLSPRMLELARRRVGEGRVRYVNADARTLSFPDAAYDLIVTHFFLDCFEQDELTSLVARIRRAASPGAQWLISEFRFPQQFWRALAARAFVAGMYAFFRITTGLKTSSLVDHRPVLDAHGFLLERTSYMWGGLLASELWRG
jgi:ubiquinone/menaquinone biosynthesis C-methylase UbiE